MLTVVIQVHMWGSLYSFFYYFCKTLLDLQLHYSDFNFETVYSRGFFNPFSEQELEVWFRKSK